MTPAAILRPVLPAFVQNPLHVAKNLARVRVIRALGSPYGNRLQLLAAHNRPHPQAGGVVIKIMANVGVTNQVLAGGTDGEEAEVWSSTPSFSSSESVT